MQTKDSWAAFWPPLTLGYGAAFLREAGFEVILWDATALRMDSHQLAGRLKKDVFDLAVVTSGFPSFDGDIKAVKTIRRASPKTKIVMIGMVPTLLEKEVFRLCPDLDHLIVGEPEWQLKKLALAIKSNRFSEKILRADFQKDNVNELPFPARDLLDNDRYLLPINGQKFTLLSVGRGCPYRCSFCTASNYYSRIFRKRKVESVAGEIQECVEKHNIRQFLFWGETFTLDPNYARLICQAIIKRKLPISWATTTRADTLTPALLVKMKRAGCDMLSIGIESIDDKILRVVNKGTTFAQTEKALVMIRAAGIRRMGHFIFGLPGQGKKQARAMIDFALKSGLEYAQFYCAVPYPKTPLGELARKNGWLDKNADWSDYSMTKSVMGNGILTAGEIQNFRDLAYRKFYLRPKMAKQAIKDISSPLSLLRSLEFLKWMKR